MSNMPHVSHLCADHDERFKGVMFATNGCLACECEILAKRAAEDAATIARLTADLAECYRLSGADPDGNEDWRLAERAVQEVREYRQDSDAVLEECGRETERLTQERDEARQELATCCLCEYEFDEPHTPTDRGRQVVCAKCWPHDADARGWKARAEKAEAALATLREATQRERDRAQAIISYARSQGVAISWAAFLRDGQPYTPHANEAPSLAPPPEEPR